MSSLSSPSGGTWRGPPASLQPVGEPRVDHRVDERRRFGLVGVGRGDVVAIRVPTTKRSERSRRSRRTLGRGHVRLVRAAPAAVVPAVRSPSRRMAGQGRRLRPLGLAAGPRGAGRSTGRSRMPLAWFGRPAARALRDLHNLLARPPRRGVRRSAGGDLDANHAHHGARSTSQGRARSMVVPMLRLVHARRRATGHVPDLPGLRVGG